MSQPFVLRHARALHYAGLAAVLGGITGWVETFLTWPGIAFVLLYIAGGVVMEWVRRAEHREKFFKGDLHAQ